MYRMSIKNRKKVVNRAIIFLLCSLALVCLINFCETNLRYCFQDTTSFYEEKRYYIGKTRKLKRSLLEKYANSGNEENFTSKNNTIEIAIVSVGVKNKNKLTNTFSGLLKQTNLKFLFHLIGDLPTFDLFRRFLKVYETEHDVLFYDFNEFSPLIAFYPNARLSGVYPIMKLLIPDILPLTTSKVIVVDPDVDFYDEASSLWSAFDGFDEDQMIGVKTKSFSHGDFYETRVLLMDLRKMRKVRWYWFWRGETLKAMLVIKELRRATEDVIYLLSLQRPEIFKKLLSYLN